MGGEPQRDDGAAAPPPLVLASGSRYKQELFGKLGHPFRLEPADIDEIIAPGEPPLQAARRLAQEKAMAVLERIVARADGPAPAPLWVVGGDQVIALGEEILRKPNTVEAARAQLARLAGQTHSLHCAVALAQPGREVMVEHVSVEMEMRPLSAAQIAAYVEEDRPLDCAGSYRVEAAGVRLFRSMRCDDFTAIVGLPLTRVQDLLERAGYER